MEKSKIPGLITILIMTLITSIMWIGFAVYRAFTNKPATNVPQAVIQALTPTLDNSAISKIQGRVYFDESSIPEPSVGPTATPITRTPVPTLTPPLTASSSALPTANASAVPPATPKI